MAALKGVVTLTNTASSTTISVSNPVALILWGTHTTQANGSEAADAVFGMGFATFNESVIQQVYSAQHADDATAAGTYTTSFNTDRVMTILAAAGVEDGIVEVSAWDSAGITLDWSGDPPATNGLLLHYLVLTTSELEAAVAGSWTASDVDESISLASDIGKPDALLFAHPNLLRTTAGTGRTDLGMGVGVASSSTARYSTTLWAEDTSATIDAANAAGTRALYAFNGSGIKTFEMDLTVDSGGGAWPADGFRVTYPDTAAGLLIGYLGMKLAAGAALTVGTTSTLTSGGPQDLAHSAAPTCAFMIGGLNINGTNETGAETGGIWAGGWDGTNEGGAGHLIDNGTANEQAGRWHRDDKAMVVYRIPASATNPPTLDAQADGSASGSNFRLTYSNFSSTARSFGYIIFSAAAGGGSPTPKRLATMGVG